MTLLYRLLARVMKWNRCPWCGHAVTDHSDCSTLPHMEYWDWTECKNIRESLGYNRCGCEAFARRKAR